MKAAAKKIVIIGAGPAGLAAALRLCAQPERRKEEKYKSRQIKRFYFERKTSPERRAAPLCGAARLSKNIVSKDNKSIAAKLSFAVICLQ